MGNIFPVKGLLEFYIIPQGYAEFLLNVLGLADHNMWRGFLDLIGITIMMLLEAGFCLDFLWLFLVIASKMI